MRKKVFLIRGQANLARQLTVAAFERINIDHVVIIVALKNPQLLPEDVPQDILMIVDNIIKLANHFQNEHAHLMASEYASILIDHGSEDVRVVEGNCLQIQSLYESVKALHRQFNQVIVECEVVGPNKIIMDDTEFRIEEIIERFKPHECLG